MLSLCAGRGTDVIDVLGDHPRADEVDARLVELDPDLAARARADAAAAGSTGVEVVTGDASASDAAGGAVPADVLLACGIFGNMSAEDIHRFVDLAPTLCAPGAHRHLDPPPPPAGPHRRHPRVVRRGRLRRARVRRTRRGRARRASARTDSPPSRGRSSPDARLFTFVGDGTRLLTHVHHTHRPRRRPTTAAASPTNPRSTASAPSR